MAGDAFSNYRGWQWQYLFKLSPDLGFGSDKNCNIGLLGMGKKMYMYNLVFLVSCVLVSLLVVVLG